MVGLFDPRKGDPAVQHEYVTWNVGQQPPNRTNMFALIWIRSGDGIVYVNETTIPYTRHQLICLKPYENYCVGVTRRTDVDVIRFHANFLCVETYHAEVGCAGLLFNDNYQLPIVPFDDSMASGMTDLMEHIEFEMTANELAREEMLLVLIKTMLIRATRIKSTLRDDQPVGLTAAANDELMSELADAIEQNFRTLHRPSDYARLMHQTSKTLGRIVRERLGKTLGELIRDRILSQAKWELLHTRQPIKVVAHDLGFRDELYFSRMFKKATGYSPKFFREFETEIRGGSNLSMNSGDHSIPRSE